MSDLQIGTARARPGEVVTGWLGKIDLPTGTQDRFPVILAQGKDPHGPVCWVTAGIHGGEHAGVIVAQQLVTPELVARLRGTLVVIPTLNPAGLRTKERKPYYYDGDPNRLFPEPNAYTPPDEIVGLEAAYLEVYRAIEESGACCLLDLHTAQIGSIPLVFRDPIFYHRRFGRGLSRSDALALQSRLSEMLDALGLPVINEFGASSYLSRGLHRSVTGSVLNGLGIPAATIELGSWMHVDEHVVEGCLAGLRNVLRWAGLLPGKPERVTGIKRLDADRPLRRCIHPKAPHAGIVHHLVRPGTAVHAGDPVARLTDIFGQPVGDDDGLIRSEYDGYVLAWQQGVVRYEGEAIMIMAIPDDSELVIPYPY